MRERAAWNKTQYTVFTSDGRELNLSVCNSVTITEVKSINTNYEKLNYDFAMKLLKEEGVNIYDPNEPVFNDKCCPLQIDGKDTTLSDRKNKILSKVSLCDEGCEMKNLNTETKQVQCECVPNVKGITMDNLIKENSIVADIQDLFSGTNVYLFTCYKKVFEYRNIKQKYGASINFSLLLIEIVLFAIFLFFQLKTILISMCINIPVSPPVNFIIKNEIISNISQELTTKHSICSSKEKFMIQLSKGSNSIESNTKEREEDPAELNEMSYEDAKEKDNRTFWKYYLSIVSEKQIILSPILFSSIFQPLSLRSITFVFIIQAFFFLNALFFTEEYISKRFDQEGKLDFMYILQNELQKSVLASVVCMLISKLFTMFIPKVSSYYQLIDRKGDENSLLKLRELIKTLKIKLMILLIIILVFSIAFLYFLLTFCSIYYNTQLSWIQSTLLSIASNIILYFTLCLISRHLDSFLLNPRKSTCLKSDSSFMN